MQQFRRYLTKLMMLAFFLPALQSGASYRCLDGEPCGASCKMALPAASTALSQTACTCCHPVPTSHKACSLCNHTRTGLIRQIHDMSVGCASCRLSSSHNRSITLYREPISSLLGQEYHFDNVLFLVDIQYSQAAFQSHSLQTILRKPPERAPPLSPLITL